MGLFDFWKQKVYFTRDSSGNWHISKGNTNYLACNQLELYKTNSVLNTVLNFGGDYLSKFKFGVRDKDGTINYDSPLLDLLKKPNEYQSKEDFLKQYYIFRCVFGYNYILPSGTVAERASYLYNLRADKIDHNYNNKPFIFRKKSDIRNNKSTFFKYTDGDKENTYQYKDIIPFYDTVNGVGEDNNPYIAPSKLNALIKELSNLDAVLDSENIAINKVGNVAVFKKDKSSNDGTTGFDDVKPYVKQEKQDVKRAFNNKKDRLLLPDMPLEKMDLTIDMKKIGLNESFSRNQGIVVQAFGFSNELYNYLTKGATFENRKEAEIQTIQNYFQPIADDLANSLTPIIGNPETPFVATIDHAPTMASTEERKAEKAKKVAETMKVLIDSGYNKEEAFNLVNDNFGLNINKE